MINKNDVIKLLPDHIINQIAAGEVVHRPACVVKELMENSIDAKADNIKLIIIDSGKSLIQVIDNGIGMSFNDLNIAFDRHTTSKIYKSSDINYINTKGFRGEALSSICSISIVNAKTKTNYDEIGNEFISNFSEKIIKPCIFQVGTSISVKNLFYNVPARRKFLKSDYIEFNHIQKEFIRISLSHPEIEFYLKHNDKVIYHLKKSNLKKRLSDIFGDKILSHILNVKEDTNIVTINGYICKPEIFNKNKGDQYLFVNDRYIVNIPLKNSILECYKQIISKEYIPSYFIYLYIDPANIDINIHPNKTHIRFRDEEAICSILKSTIRYSLGQFSIPSLNFDSSIVFDDKNIKDIILPTIKIDKSFNPFNHNSNYSRKDNNIIDQNLLELHKENDYNDNYILNNDESDNNIIKINKSFNNYYNLEESNDSNQTTISEYIINNRIIDYLYLNNSYIVVNILDDLYIIDQARAHEKIIFENLKKDLTIKFYPQTCLFPINFNISNYEYNNIKKLEKYFKNVGFNFTFDKISVEIYSHPSFIRYNDIENIFKEIIFELKGTQLEENFLKIISRKVSIKKGVKLNKEQILNLVENLFGLKEFSSILNDKLILFKINSNYIKNILK